jgi:hypothetical protein
MPSRKLPLRSFASAHGRLAACIAAVVGLLALAGCSARIESVTSVTQTGATLNARFACNQGEAGAYWLEYRRVGATGGWTQVGRRSFNCTAAGSEQRPYQVSGMSAGTSYEARLCADLSGLVPPLCNDADGTIHAVSDSSSTRSDVSYIRFTTTGGATSSAVTLRQVDGGPGYYGQFSNALPTAASYFPIGVWGSYNHTQANRDLDAAAGLNLYVWAADNIFMSQIRSDGRFRVIQDEGNRSGVGSETAGWLLGDEIDMCCGPPGYIGGNGYNMLTSTLASLPSDGRARYANYGKGVMFWQTDAQAQRFVNEFQQLISNDVYWFTDPNERSRQGYRLAAAYGWTVDRMRALDAMDRRPWEDAGGRKPIWNFVETGWPFTESAAQGGRAITGPEIRAAVWHSLIAGARGIIYFQHSFGGPRTGDHHTIRSNSEGTRPAVTAVNAQVKSLAPVLNAPTVEGLVSSSPGLRTLAKWQGGRFWVFAGRTQNGGQTSNTINLPCVGSATAAVDGEGRTVPLTAGRLTDSFADGNAIHIYRIDGGSSCGLPAG